MTESRGQPRADPTDQLIRLWVEEGRNDVLQELFGRLKAEWARPVRRSCGARGSEEFEDRMQALLLHAFEHAAESDHPRIYAATIRTTPKKFRTTICKNFLRSWVRKQIRDEQRTDAWSRGMSQDADLERHDRLKASEGGQTPLTDRKGDDPRPMDRLRPVELEHRLESLDHYAEAAQLLPELVVRRRVAVGLCIVVDCLPWAGELAEAQHQPPRTIDSETDATARISLAQQAQAGLAERCAAAVAGVQDGQGSHEEVNATAQEAVAALESELEAHRIRVLYPSADAASNLANWNRIYRHGVRNLKERVRARRSAPSLGPTPDPGSPGRLV